MDCILCDVRGFVHDKSSKFGFICNECGEYEVTLAAIQMIKSSYDWLEAGSESTKMFTDNLKDILKDLEKPLLLRCHVEYAVNNATKR